MKRILITGGLGFVGGRLTRKLAQSHEILVSSRATVTKSLLEQHGDINWIQHDKLCSSEFPENIDTVIHLAALNEMDCVKHPSEAIRVNIDQTRILLEAAIQKKVQQFIYFSTAHVYGSPLQGNIDETTLPVPVHPYSITHKAAEDYVLAAGASKKIHPLVIRLSNSFGSPVSPTVNRWTLLANDLCRQAVEKGSLNLLSNGCQYRDFICLTDVEAFIAEVLERDAGTVTGIFNLGAGHSMKVIDMAQLIAGIYKEEFGKSIPVVLPKDSNPTVEPELNFSIDKLKGAGFDIKNPIREELKDLLHFCHKNFSQNA